VHINCINLIKRLTLKTGVRESKFLLPYLIGAQFGGALGVAILQLPLSLGSAIDLAITFVILLMICGFVDLGGALRRKVANRFAFSARA
jgi:hypothetical protein